VFLTQPPILVPLTQPALHSALLILSMRLYPGSIRIRQRIYGQVISTIYLSGTFVGSQPILRLLSRTHRTPVQAAASCNVSPYFERRRFITVFVSQHSSSISNRRLEQLATPFP